MLQQCKNLSYTQWLIFLKLPALVFLGEIEQIWSKCTNIDRKVWCNLVPKLQWATSSVTKGNFLNLAALHSIYCTCKYSFKIRSVKL